MQIAVKSTLKLKITVVQRNLKKKKIPNCANNRIYLLRLSDVANAQWYVSSSSGNLQMDIFGSTKVAGPNTIPLLVEAL